MSEARALLVEEFVNDWNVINDQVNRSQIKRYDYRKIFGRTLTEIITDLKKKGLTSTEAVHSINDSLAVRGIVSLDLYRKVKISVCSRYGEQDSMRKRRAV